MTSRPVLLIAALLSAGCTASTGTEPSRLGTSLPFKVGTSYDLPAGGALSVSLLAVENDSRCPASVQCVTAGSATITLGVQLGTGPTVPASVSLGATNNTVATGTLRATFDSLTPYPAVPGPLKPQSAYTAWLTFRPAP